MRNPLLNGTYKAARLIVVCVVGFTLLVFGVIMLVTPGPGLAAIAAGLAVLAIEFAWARAWLKRVRRKISEAGEQIRGRSIDAHSNDVQKKRS